MYDVQNATISDILDARSADGKTSPFLLFSGSESLTASQLDHLAGRVATKLAALGVVKGARVLVCFRHSPEMLSMLMACWKLGAIVLPTDRFIDTDALRIAIANTQPTAAIFGPWLDEQAERMAPILKENNIAFAPIRHEELPSQPHPGCACESDAPALCLFTSGSTGLPKGVVLSHANLLAGARNVVATTEVDKDDRALCVLTLAHLNGLVTTFLTPLVSGGSVVYLEEDFTPTRVAKLIDKFRCTWFSATPTQYALMISPPLEKTAFSFASLKFCRSASAPLPARVFDEFEAHYGVPMIETMGTTESAGQIFSNPMPPAARKAGHVGFPNRHVEVRLVDEQGKPVVAPRVQGELQVRGDCMMLGYHNDPETTASAFDHGWFKTGDICEFDEEGYYRITGRTKEIAIYCGLNVSLRAIQDAVQEQGIVLDAACVGREHPVFGEIIDLYAVPYEQTQETAYPDLVRALADTARPYIPNALALGQVKLVREFKRSGVGKTLKGFLPELEVLYAHDRRLPTEPEELLAHVLGVPRESIDDDAMIGSLKQWDSLAHVSLMLATEDVLGRRLSRIEMNALLTLHGLRLVLKGDGATVLKSRKSAIRTVVQQLNDAGYGDGPTINYLMMSFAHCAAMHIYDPDALLDALIEALPSGAHLIMNAFTWDFCTTGRYHHVFSKTSVGLINDLFLRRQGTVRSEHPIYSYAIFGPNAAEIARFDCGTCWGEGSLTWKLGTRKDVRTLTYGLPKLYNSLFRANPVVHAAEEKHQVPYRYFKKFEGTVDYGSGPKRYATSMYVRRLEPEALNNWTKLSSRLCALPDTVYDEDVPIMAYWCHKVMELSSELLGEDAYALAEKK
ncbi:MAG: AMP-binding protein [Pseudomonadota bacterium]